MRNNFRTAVSDIMLVQPGLSQDVVHKRYLIRTVGGANLAISSSIIQLNRCFCSCKQLKIMGLDLAECKLDRNISVFTNRCERISAEDARYRYPKSETIPRDRIRVI